MTDPHKEQHPLLCDEYSDEDFHIQDTGPKFQRRFSRSVSSGRARTHAVGAAAIITSWPDHVSSLLQYWWISLGMIAVMVFLIYNSFLAIAVLPRSHYHPSKIQSPKYTIENKSNENPSPPNIYMHVFVANYNEFNRNNYIPYVHSIAKKYTNFNYNFIVLLNDATQDIDSDLSDEHKNEMALNLLWTDNEITNKEKRENPIVKFSSLTKYMDNSPLKKYWRRLPYQFIGFFARCIAIWDKGGVAFNPLILTPNSPNPIYLEKLHGVLENYQSNNKLMSPKKRKISKKPKKKLNNIRDIINDLENGDMNSNIFTDSLAEAENIQSVTTTALKYKRNANLVSFVQSNFPEYIEKQKDEILHKNNSYKDYNNRIPNNFIKSIKSINSTTSSGMEAVQNILPKFLDFFFHFDSKNLTSNTQNITRAIKLSENNRSNDFFNNDSKSKIAPIESSIKIKTKSTNKTSGNESTKLVIDLKGNLIATEIGCHAFIGSVFSNVLHHNYLESVTEFIISELSLFCKGILSTCKNVEVLLI